jgi:hypothetical protein
MKGKGSASKKQYGNQSMNGPFSKEKFTTQSSGTALIQNPSSEANNDAETDTQGAFSV